MINPLVRFRSRPLFAGLASLAFLAASLPAHAELIDPNKGCAITATGECAPPPPRPQFVPSQLPPPSVPQGAFIYCYATGAVPGTKNVIFSNIFQSAQASSSWAAQIANYERQYGIDVAFECVSDVSRMALMNRYNGHIAALSVKGLNIAFVNVNPKS